MTTKNKQGGKKLKKMGRPTNEPKPYKVVARITAKQKNILENYCKEKECNQMQAIRDGIDKLENKNWV